MEEIISLNSSFRECTIPEKMTKDGFAALALSILQDMFISSDMKIMIFEGMLHNLKMMNYSKEDVETFRVAVNEAYKKFHTPNSFMG